MAQYHRGVIRPPLSIYNFNFSLLMCLSPVCTSLNIRNIHSSSSLKYSYNFDLKTYPREVFRWRRGEGGGEEAAEGGLSTKEEEEEAGATGAAGAAGAAEAESAPLTGTRGWRTRR